MSSFYFNVSLSTFPIFQKCPTTATMQCHTIQESTNRILVTKKYVPIYYYSRHLRSKSCVQGCRQWLMTTAVMKLALISFSAKIRRHVAGLL